MFRPRELRPRPAGSEVLSCLQTWLLDGVVAEQRGRVHTTTAVVNAKSRGHYLYVGRDGVCVCVPALYTSMDTEVMREDEMLGGSCRCRY